MADRESSNPPPIPISEHSRVLIAMHKAMRVDSQRLIGAVDTLPAGDTQQAAALGRAFAAIVGLIHDHHWTEDDVMYPFLLERVPTFEDDALRLENDHVELDAAMSRINARFRLLAHQLSARLWQDTRSHLLDEAAAFNRVLVDHLDREEAVVVPPFESMLSEADQHTLQKEEAKLSTYRHMRMAVPWVLANATPEEAESLRATAPRLLGVVQDRVWEPRCAALWPRCTSRPRPEPHDRQPPCRQGAPGARRGGSGAAARSPSQGPRWRHRGESQHSRCRAQEDHAMNSPRRSSGPLPIRRRRQRPAAAQLAALRVGAAAVGAAAVGAGAVGALAVGRLAVGRAVVRRLQIEDLEVTRLHVQELRVDEQATAAQPATPSASQP